MHCTPTHRLISALVLALVCMPLASCRRSVQTELTISAAASLTEALQQIEANYQKKHPELLIHNNFAASGLLAQQIEQGAPADLLLSAASKPVDALEQHGLVEPGSRRNLLENDLVLIAPADSTLRSLAELGQSTKGRVAVGSPETVPAGQYAMQSLRNLKLDQKLSSRLVYAHDVRQVLAYVASGDVDAGFVYATDAATTRKVRIVEVVPGTVHDPVVYPAVLIAHGSHTAEARALLDYLESEEAKRVWQQHGFTVRR